MSQATSYTPPPVSQATELAQGSNVRRHHTISNPGRMGGRITESRDNEEIADYEDETEDQWTGGSALASEKQASLQRNLSLPSKYHRVMRDQPGMPSGAMSHSQTVGGLSSLDAGPEDEEWSGVAATMYEAGDDEQFHPDQTNPENENATSPPTAGVVRRHVSMTDGQRARRGNNLGRFPTISGRPPRSSTMDATTEAPDDDDSVAYAYADAEGAEYDDPSSYPAESAYGGLQQNTWEPTPGTDPAWRNNAAGNPDWRHGQQPSTVDDLANNLGNIDLQQGQPQNYARGGPRFEGAGGGYQDHYAQQLQQARQNALTHAQRLALNTEVPVPTGPVSASAFVPPPGHAPHGSAARDSIASLGSGEEHHRTSSGSEWDQKGRILKGRGSNPNIGQGYQGGQYGGAFGNMPPPPPIPAQYLNQVQSGRLMSGGGGGGYGAGQQFNTGGLSQQAQMPGGMQQPPPTLDPASFLSSPVDVPTMIAQKGYNPATFDTRPAFARYFVIKSYTEDDVHKSLKYEIWSSTDPGNKRLDKAFKECAGRGPIYLFFSVNASGHFCGMAEMLTPVDYTRSSTVWASDKWKGVFKVRWVFVRDIPNAVLRNIRLNNTQERKPVTNSRDTQELLPEAGHEMLRIFFTHPAKTSLLQDFAFYELQSLQKQQQQVQQAAMGSPPQATSPPPGLASPQQVPYTMPGQQHVPYGQQQINHGQQLQSNQPGLGNAMLGSMSMPMGVGHLGMQSPGPQYGNAMGLGVGPQVAQSVLRGSSPGPIGSGIPNYGGLNMGGAGANGGNGVF